MKAKIALVLLVCISGCQWLGRPLTGCQESVLRAIAAAGRQHKTVNQGNRMLVLSKRCRRLLDRHPQLNNSRLLERLASVPAGQRLGLLQEAAAIRRRLKTTSVYGIAEVGSNGLVLKLTPSTGVLD